MGTPALRIVSTASWCAAPRRDPALITTAAERASRAAFMGNIVGRGPVGFLWRRLKRTTAAREVPAEGTWRGGATGHGGRTAVGPGPTPPERVVTCPSLPCVTVHPEGKRAPPPSCMSSKPCLSTWLEHLEYVAHHPDKSWSNSPSSGLTWDEPVSGGLISDPLNFGGTIAEGLISGGRTPGGHCGGSRSGCSAW